MLFQKLQASFKEKVRLLFLRQVQDKLLGKAGEWEKDRKLRDTKRGPDPETRSLPPMESMTQCSLCGKAADLSVLKDDYYLPVCQRCWQTAVMGWPKQRKKARRGDSLEGNSLASMHHFAEGEYVTIYSVRNAPTYGEGSPALENAVRCLEDMRCDPNEEC